MTKRVSGFCMASMVASVVACGSTGFGGHGHSSPPPKAHHEAPKHAASKPAPKPQSKPKPHEQYKSTAAHPNHDHHQEMHHHDQHHHHDHWDHEWVGGLVVGNGVTSDGTSGVVTAGDGGVAPAVVAADVAAPRAAGRPQIQFSVDSSERDTYEVAARAAGMSRAEWIRSRLHDAAGRELKQ